MSTEYRQLPYTTDDDIERADELHLIGWTQVVTGTRTVLFERTCEAKEIEPGGSNEQV